MNKLYLSISKIESRKIYVLLLIVFLQSCALTGLQETNEEFAYSKILTDTSDTYIYKIEIDLYDNYFSGLLIIKPEKEGHRIVFINEIGMKFFDIELGPDTYRVHHIFQAMNKKAFINLLVSDFKFILMYGINSEIKFFKEKKSGAVVIKPNKKKELFFYETNSPMPEKSYRYSLLRKNTYLTYDTYNNNIPQNISIKHKNVKFAMKLSFIQ